MANVFRKRADALTKENPLWEIAETERAEIVPGVEETRIGMAGGNIAAGRDMTGLRGVIRIQGQGSSRQGSVEQTDIQVGRDHHGHQGRMIAEVMIHGHRGRAIRAAGRISRAARHDHRMKEVSGATGLIIMTRVTA